MNPSKAILMVMKMNYRAELDRWNFACVHAAEHVVYSGGSQRMQEIQNLLIQIDKELQEKEME